MDDKEIADMIEETLIKAISETTELDDGDILVDWVVVTYVVNADKEKGNGYPVFFPNGDTPAYKIRGLLHTALAKFFVSFEPE